MMPTFGCVEKINRFQKKRVLTVSVRVESPVFLEKSYKFFITSTPGAAMKIT